MQVAGWPTIILVQSSHLFWPADRKLFRQRSRLRTFLPVVAFTAAVLLALAFKHTGWN